jgi:hypothetical protein
MQKITVRGAAALLLCAIALCSRGALAQHTISQLSLTGGVATDQRGARSNALSVAPSITFAPGTRATLSIGGNATRFTSEAWSLGLGAQLAGRDALSRFLAVTLNASATASRLSASTTGTYVLADVTPALEITLPRVTLFGAIRGATGSLREETRGNGLPIGGTPTTVVHASRRGAGPLVGAVVNVADALQINAREERMKVDAIDVVDRSVGVALRHEGTSLSATIGQRDATDERASFGAVNASVMIGARASLELAAGRYARNRVLGTPAGDFFSAGLSYRFGRVARHRDRDVARPLPRGATRLSIRAPEARRVDVAGDFNDWRATPASRAPDGVWYVDLRLAPGQYRYAFRINGSVWRVPDGATAVEDGFGGKSAWVTVSVAGSGK